MLGRAGVLVPEVERTEGFRLRLPPAAAARSAEACDMPARGAEAVGSRWLAFRALLAPVLGVLRARLRDEAVEEERR